MYGDLFLGENRGILQKIPHFKFQGFIQYLKSKLQISLIGLIESLHIFVLFIVEIGDVGVDKKRIVVKLSFEEYLLLFHHVHRLKFFEIKAIVFVFLLFVLIIIV